MILLVGSEGNMGKRYKAIFEFLKLKYIGVDLGTKEIDYDKVTSVLIATPTNTHVNLIRYYSKLKVPILCEKPITKDAEELADLVDFCDADKIKLGMVNQYAFMPNDFTSPISRKRNETYYNYFKTGTDGLAWDCINLIGLSNGDDITLLNKSPIWKCTINGRDLDFHDIDYSYIAMLKFFLLRGYGYHLAYIESSHRKVHEYLKGHPEHA